MVFFGGENHEFSVPEAQYLRGQGGKLQTTGRQLYPGYGTTASSVSFDLQEFQHGTLSKLFRCLLL